MSVIFMYWVNASILARISRALEEVHSTLHHYSMSQDWEECYMITQSTWEKFKPTIIKVTYNKEQLETAENEMLNCFN